MNRDDTASLLDLRHAATDHASFVVVGPRRFFAIDGLGPPTSAEFRFALDPLRSIAERVRSRVLARLPAEARDRVPAAIPECLWWNRDLAAPDDLVRGIEDRRTWEWRQLVEIPAGSSETDTAEAIDAVSRSAGRAAPLVRIVELTEGRAAQMLHIGGSATIGATLARLYGAIAAGGETPGRTIHELRTADERLVPVERAHLIVRVPLEPVSTR
jgi:hypothetical protein